MGIQSRRATQVATRHTRLLCPRRAITQAPPNCATWANEPVAASSDLQFAHPWAGQRRQKTPPSSVVITVARAPRPPSD